VGGGLGGVWVFGGGGGCLWRVGGMGLWVGVGGGLPVGGGFFLQPPAGPLINYLENIQYSPPPLRSNQRPSPLRSHIMYPPSKGR